MLAKEILSLQHPIVKHLVALRSSKAYRKEQGTLLITGSNMFSEIAGLHNFRRILLQRGHPIPFSYKSEETLIVTEEILRKITGLSNPEPIAAEVVQPPPSDLTNFQRILILDRISDPGNLGTLLRTALALGWNGVFHLEGSVDLFNDKALRASKGAIFHIPFVCGDEPALIKLMGTKNRRFFVADAQGEDVRTIKPSDEPLMLALSNESQGSSEFFRSHFHPIALLMQKEMESLNVAIAGGILMYILGDRHAP